MTRNESNIESAAEGDHLDQKAIVARVVETVAASTGRDPATLRHQLDDAVDLGALVTVLRSGTSVHVSFDYGDQTVEVYDDGSVGVDQNCLGYASRDGVES